MDTPNLISEAATAMAHLGVSDDGQHRYSGVLMRLRQAAELFERLSEARDACADYGYSTGRTSDARMVELEGRLVRAAVAFVDQTRRDHEHE